MSDEQNPQQPRPPYTYTTQPQIGPPATKGLSPLAIVLMLSTGFFFLFLVVVGAVFFMRSSDGWEEASGSKGSASLFEGSKGTVGVLEVEGVIMDSKKLLKQIKEFKDDKSIKALVVRLNTPGGAVAPSQEIYEAVRRFGDPSRPVVASMGAVAASGGYYIAAGTDKIFANAGTLTGSIGVIMEFANLKRLYEWAKVERFAITSGKFKNAGAEYKDMDPEARDLFKTMIMDTERQFKEAVAEGRKMTMEKLNRVADGRVLTGAQAKAVGLVDTLGTLEDAVNEAARMAKIKGEPRVVYPRKPKKSLIEMMSQPEEEVSGGGGRWADALLMRLARAVLREGTGAQAWVNPGLSEKVPGVYWLWADAIR
ncbi:MAG: signal peptide peptidase SppA [Bdellovibrionales bacterium]|nr:signal peptide peptidase SppA [Bdellovibrionales bacterium]